MSPTRYSFHKDINGFRWDFSKGINILNIPKRNGTNEVRVCTDARWANKAIQRERHLTPTVDDLAVKLNGCTVFSKFDLKKGYNQLLISEDSRFITAFCTHVGVFRYKRLNFGINTAAELFQKAVESVLSTRERKRTRVVNSPIVFFCVGVWLL